MESPLISFKEAEHLIERNNVQSWKKQVVEQVKSRILNKDYPCIFTKSAYDHDHIMINFINDPFSEDDLNRSFVAINEFITLINNTRNKQSASMKTLLLCIDCNEMGADDEPKAVWHLLNGFLRLDSSAWPMDVPTDPENEEWAYSLLGKRAFITALTPSHKKRHSRNIGSHMVLLFQLRDGIEHVAPYNAKGDNIRELIRQRIEAYDDVPLAPDMTTHGDGGNKDWTQYWLGDSMESHTGKCPLHDKYGE
ncbi:YqcI/YcgG family protein [Marinomonas sp. THO17]|uniref:YqcI/YcgG family protein n=1 Tax=Marinomonas sp. THO17 TaxID=3149048 RepID=UPI00336BD06B